ncbi:helix-turn-helix transcriptional regulator [Nocardia sp. NPDC060259]|uniref:helix-turn-helix transcriptional regulator n=1 Tax=Nocardia sp. NPDC060259 TaxID=3347088 RepID=UPI00365B1315
MRDDPVDLETFSTTVEAIYAAAAEPSLWPGTVDRIVTMFDAAVGSLVTSAPDDQRIALGVGLDTTSVDSYNRYYRDLDPIARIVARSAVGEVGCVFEVLSRRQLTESEFFVDWARPTGLGDGVFARFSDRADGPSWLCVAAEPNKGFASTGRIELIRHLVPHLRAAAAIQLRSTEASQSLRLTTQILEHLDGSALLVEEHGLIHHMNAAARAILTRADGLLVVRGGKLGTTVGADRAALHELVLRACGDCCEAPIAGSISLTRPSTGGRYVVHAIPICTDDDPCRPGRLALLTIVDPTESASAVPARTWRSVYGLTAREAGIVEHVIRGDGLQAVADALGVTLSTVRTHLQHVFDKTGTRRQKDLARLLLSSTPSIR